jgi:hypothetical protein
MMLNEIRSRKCKVTGSNELGDEEIMQTGNIPRDKAVAARAYDNASS